MIDFDAAKAEILDWVSQAVRTPAEEIDLTQSFSEIGLDSLDAVHMVATIESLIQRELPEDIIERTQSLGDIFEMMRTHMAAA